MLNVRVTTGHRPDQEQEEPAGWRRFTHFCQKSQNFFATQSKLLNSKALAGGFVMGCAKKVLVSSIYKKVVEKSAV